MFIGRFAVGFAAKKFAPRTNMAILLAAPLFLDLLWPFFLILGWEHVRIDPGNTRFTPLDLYDFPWSHSLLMSIVWATLFSLIYHLITRYGPGTIVIWISVVSHWVLDWITHRPDMPLYPGGPRYGLALWNSVPGTLTVELLMFAVGVCLYIAPRKHAIASATTLSSPTSQYLSSSISVTVSAPHLPASAKLSGLESSRKILLAWPWWFDRHRVLRVQTQ